MPSPQSGWPSEQMCSCNELLLIGNSNVLICGFLVPDLLSVMLQFYHRSMTNVQIVTRSPALIVS